MLKSQNLAEILTKGCTFKKIIGLTMHQYFLCTMLKTFRTPLVYIYNGLNQNIEISI